MCTIYDVTDKKLYQQKIERQANNDFLTGLYNRMRCEQDLERYIRQTKEFGGEGALLYIDLDDFKHINDGLGHQYGDVLLKNISGSLQRIPVWRITVTVWVVMSSLSYWRIIIWRCSSRS